MAREKKASVNVEGTTLKFDFTTDDLLVFDVTQLSDDIKTKALIHGVRQKIQDSYAGVDADKAYVAANAVAQAMLDGNWSTRTEGTGGGVRTSLLAEALARATGQALDACIAAISTMDDDTKKSVRSHPQVKKAMMEIKLERAREELENLDENEEAFELPLIGGAAGGAA
jgi:hypothetical protein